MLRKTKKVPPLKFNCSEPLRGWCPGSSLCSFSVRWPNLSRKSPFFIWKGGGLSYIIKKCYCSVPFLLLFSGISKSSSTITSAALETETLSLVRKIPKLLQKRTVNAWTKATSDTIYSEIGICKIPPFSQWSVRLVKLSLYGIKFLPLLSTN